MNGPLIQILTGTLGTLGYALVFHVRVKLLPAATMGGLVSWAVYLLIYFPTHNLFLASLIAAMAVYAWSEIMARLMKAPVTVFLLPGVIPLLPGSFLYYTTLALLNEDAVQFKIQGLNTIASTYSYNVKTDVVGARIRKYSSARAAALSGDNIPEEVYDNLIQTVRANTKPLQDYVSLRKQILGIEDFHFYDFFVPIVKDVAREYPYDEGKEIVLKATAVLGEDYNEIMRHGVDDRWIDIYPGKNKMTGAYSTGAYGFHPYMLLNYDNTLEDVFTLGHELGHSMHTYFSQKNQPYLYSDYSIFCAEVASTTNEMLLFHDLLQKAQTDEERALLLSKHLDDIRSTFYRQTMFADFEYQTHKLAEEGAPLLPSTLCEIHRKLNADYYGPEFAADDTISYEWARIPHFYRNFYVYQYATGITAAIAISRRIRELGQPAVDDYRKFLASGSSAHPIELLKIAGVDMASPQPVLDTVADFAETLAELKKALHI